MSMSTSRGSARTALTGTGRGGAAARQSTLRAHNLALVLRRVVAAHAEGHALSRAGIAGEVGLARATVSDLTDRLIGARLVTELDPRATRGAGRPAVPLVPAARSVVGLGLSIGTDHLGAVVVDLTGLRITERVVGANPRRLGHRRSFERLAELAVDTCRPLLAEGMQVAGACVALPGIVSRESARLRVAPNLGWADIAVDAALHAHPGLATLRVRVGNDADLAARTEVDERRRAGRPVDDQSYLFVLGDVGIGSAVVLGGEVFGGTHGWTGEMGHVVVHPDGPPCKCGSIGCLEPYAGWETLARAAGLPSTPDAPALLAAAATPGPAADALAAAAVPLGQAAATVINVVGLDELILGGTYAPLFDHLAEGVRAELLRRALLTRWSEVRISAAVGGPNAAARGAALTVLDGVIADPAAWNDALR